MNKLSSQGLRLTALIVCMLVLHACGRQESGWEKALMGPFRGEPFNEELIAKPESSLQLPTNKSMEVHWQSRTSDPIIRLCDENGMPIWARVLVPRLEGQNEPRGRITQMTLNEIKASTGGFKIKLSCDWTGGGKEGGMIYLDTNYAFRSFALGW